MPNAPPLIQQYIVQLLLHSVIAVLVVEALLKLWNEEDPRQCFRFRLVAFILPVVAFPVFSILYPARNSADFAETHALFQSQKWLALRFGSVSMSGIIPAITIPASLVFVVQELLPALTSWKNRNRNRECLNSRFKFSASGSSPDLRVVVTGERGALLHTSGFSGNSVVISRDVLETLNREELQNALAHEAVHVLHHHNRTGWILAGFRLITFFNPVSLILFRKILETREQICDQQAAVWTKRPAALASAILKVFRVAERETFNHAAPWSIESGILNVFGELRRHGHILQVQHRVRMLINKTPARTVAHPLLRISATVAALTVLTFVVV